MNEQLTFYPTANEMSAIVTLGATREPIDDVRFITNFSSGSFGLAIADALGGHLKKLTVMAPPGLYTDWDWGNWFGENEAEYQRFTSAADLEALLLAHPPVDLVFHSAAIGDYTPIETHTGKLSSDQEEFVLKMRRTPKIINKLREHFGDESYLVGFKLLSGVSEEELIDAAQEQLGRAKTDLVVANDLQQLKPPTSYWPHFQHPVTLVETDKEPFRLVGNREDVARKVAYYALESAVQRRNSSQILCK